MVEFKGRQVTDGYVFEITGVNKIGGERVRSNDKLEQMLEIIGEAVLGYKIKVERK